MTPRVNMQYVLGYYKNLSLPKGTVVLHFTYSSFGICLLQYVRICMDPTNRANSCKPFLTQEFLTLLSSPIEASQAVSMSEDL